MALQLVQAVFCDLPVHCLRHQVAGHWTFFVGPPATTPQACGHHTPGEVRDVVLRDGGMKDVAGVLNTVRLEVLLDAPDLASTNGTEPGSTEVGWWTMVYDQGFEVRIGGRAFFAFSSVLPSPSAADFTSTCSRTAVGWYRELDSDRDAWGCYYGVRNRPAAPHSSSGDDRSSSSSSSSSSATRASSSSSSSSPRVTLVGGSSAAGAHVAQQNRSLASRAAGARAALDERPDALKYAGLPTSWDWRHVDGINYVSPVRAQASCGACYAIAAVGMLESRLAIASGGRERPALSVQEVLSCSPYSQGCLGGFPYLVGKYLTDRGVVSEACFPMQMGEGRPLCGERCDGPTRRWRASDYRYVGGRYGGCSEVEMMREVYHHGPVVAGFEANAALYTFNGQGVFSSATGASAGGFNGGAPTARPFEAMADGVDSGANAVASSELVEGASAVPSLLQVVEGSEEAGGDGGTPASNVPPEQSDAPTATAEMASFFERTNHAVLVVGWGVLDGQKYWWAQNTWGEAWGEGGYFRMARGHDDAACESMAVAVDVDGALPLQTQRRLTFLEAAELAEPPSRSEQRRIAALRRRAKRAPYSTSLTPSVDLPPPSPAPMFLTSEEPRDYATAHAADSPQHYSLLDALSHWGYGGG